VSICIAQLGISDIFTPHKLDTTRQIKCLVTSSNTFVAAVNDKGPVLGSVLQRLPDRFRIKYVIQIHGDEATVDTINSNGFSQTPDEYKVVMRSGSIVALAFTYTMAVVTIAIDTDRGFLVVSDTEIDFKGNTSVATRWGICEQ